jgi:hypothetical protein
VNPAASPDTCTLSATGLLTAVRNGKAVVKVTVVDDLDNSVDATKTFTLSNQVVEPTSVAITNTASTITTDGGTLQMTSSFTPADATGAVTWSLVGTTDKAEISTSGLLTAKKDGKVTVKATVTGSSVSAEKEITISNQVIDVTGITVKGAGSATTITTVGGTLQMEATVAPSDASNKEVTWSVSDATVASISDAGLLTAIKDGTVTVTATSKADNTKKGTVDITISGQVGIMDITASGISIYPNPANDKIHVTQFELVRSIAIYNIVGKTEINTNLTESTLDISSLKNGVYIVRVVSRNNQEEFFRLIVE